MARLSLGICLILVVASSVIYEAQGTFLLKMYLRKNFPRKCNEFTPFANRGMSTFVTDLEGSCPTTAEFKSFFTSFKSYMTFIETESAASKNVDVEMTTKADGLFKACSALAGGKGEKSADVGNFKVTMISMGKTLVEQKKNTRIMTVAEKKRLVMAMVKWTKVIATFVKSASETKGKTIDIATYGLDVDVNDKSIGGSSGKGGVSTKTKESSSGSSGSSKSTQKDSGKDSSSSSTSPKSGMGSGTTYSDKTGAKSARPSGSPTASPSGSTSVKDTKESKRGNSSSMKKEESTKSGIASSASSSSTTSVKQVETETSKEAMSFIMDLEKKYSGKAELKVFFEKLKASMTASSTISSKTTKDYVSGTRTATGKLSEAMAFVGSRYSKSAKMKSNMETAQDKLMRTLKELQDINSKIVSAKTVSSTQQSEIKQTLTKWEQVTTNFVETAASSSSSSSSTSSDQTSARMVKTN